MAIWDPFLPWLAVAWQAWHHKIHQNSASIKARFFACPRNTSVVSVPTSAQVVECFPSFTPLDVMFELMSLDFSPSFQQFQLVSSVAKVNGRSLRDNILHFCDFHRNSRSDQKFLQFVVSPASKTGSAWPYFIAENLSWNHLKQFLHLTFLIRLPNWKYMHVWNGISQESPFAPWVFNLPHQHVNASSGMIVPTTPWIKNIETMCFVL